MSTRRRRGGAPANAKQPPTPARPSALAREHDLTAEQEHEIREAFSLFSMQHPDHPESPEGVLKSSDVRRCLISLNLGPPARQVPEILSTLDPLNTGFVPFLPFFEYAALAIHSKSEDEEEGGDDDDEYDEDRRADAGEVFAAYSLFTHGGPGPITLAHLRRVAKELREEVDDEVLKDMILEANGGVSGKKNGDGGGVGFEDFEAVMRRAGISFS